MLLKTYPTIDCIIGSPDDIKSISKKELEECFKTFYNPQNMAFFVAGDVDHENILKIINENQSKKERHNYKIDAISKKEVLCSGYLFIKPRATLFPMDLPTQETSRLWVRRLCTNILPGSGNTCVLFCNRRNGAENISRS
jgi:hypothetical protein